MNNDSKLGPKILHSKLAPRYYDAYIERFGSFQYRKFEGDNYWSMRYHGASGRKDGYQKKLRDILHTHEFKSFYECRSILRVICKAGSMKEFSIGFNEVVK